MNRRGVYGGSGAAAGRRGGRAGGGAAAAAGLLCRVSCRCSPQQAWGGNAHTCRAAGESAIWSKVLSTFRSSASGDGSQLKAALSEYPICYTSREQAKQLMALLALGLERSLMQTKVPPTRESSGQGDLLGAPHCRRCLAELVASQK